MQKTKITKQDATHYQRLIGLKSTLTLFVIILSTAVSSAQSKMPKDSYTIISAAASLMSSNPRRALTRLSPLKKTFLTESSFENIEDFIIYNTLMVTENTIYSLNNNYRRIFMNLRDLQNNIEPLLSNDDRYAQSYFMSKLAMLIYKGEDKESMLYKNRSYQGALNGLIDEVRAFSFKDKVNQDQVLSQVRVFL